MRSTAPLVAVLILSSCGGSGDAPVPEANLAAGNSSAATPQAPAPSHAPQPPAAARWHLQASGEGSALALVSASGATAIRLFCPTGGGQLLVNVPSFRPIGSEERLSFGSGKVVTALVADASGDRLRGGVSGTGAVPGELAALLAAPASTSYGAQSSGPHPAPPADLARAFASACGKSGKPQPAAKQAAGGPCHVQGKEQLSLEPLRAVGTEPFWGAQIDGRCVTYLHPEDKKGQRVWTRYAPGAGGGRSWSGAYEGSPFELRIRPAPSCSDRMSDRRYPFSAELLVKGERRRGCAAPL